VVLVRDLVQDVVEVADGVDCLADVRLLDGRDVAVDEFVDLQAPTVAVRVAVDAIDVILR